MEEWRRDGRERARDVMGKEAEGQERGGNEKGRERGLRGVEGGMEGLI